MSDSKKADVARRSLPGRGRLGGREKRRDLRRSWAEGETCLDAMPDDRTIALISAEGIGPSRRV